MLPVGSQACDGVKPVSDGHVVTEGRGLSILTSDVSGTWSGGVMSICRGFAMKYLRMLFVPAGVLRWSNEGQYKPKGAPVVDRGVTPV